MCKKTMKNGRPRREVLVVAAAACTLVALGGDVPRSTDLPKPPTPDLELARSGRVVEVHGGNHIVVNLDGEATPVRLIGVYIPSASEQWPAARALVRRMLGGELVAVQTEPDWPERDRDGRLWAYVYRMPDGLCVNAELLRQGYARVSAAGPFAHQEAFRAYESWARRLDKGLWQPREAPAATTQPATGATTQPVSAAELVYVTPTGTCFHRRDCQHVDDDDEAITVEEARRRGLKPCRTCNPPDGERRGG